MDIYKYLAEISPAQNKRPGLERINSMLEYLGHPERDYQIVHIVGTNGKGSTAQFTASILQAAGLRVGLFTSPHLVQFNERIQVNGVPIPDAELNGIFQELYPRIEELAAGPYGRPGLFEVATAVALKYFSYKRVDYAVLEAGIGGRYDATRVGSPTVTVFTHIDLDHTDILGKTVEQIAVEKAEVIVPGGTVVTAPQSASVKDIIAGWRLSGVLTSSMWRRSTRSAVPGRDREEPAFQFPEGDFGGISMSISLGFSKSPMLSPPWLRLMLWQRRA